MAFSDVWFIVFFAAVYAVLWLARLFFEQKYNIISKLVLLIAGYVYITFSDWSCMIYIIVMTCVSYCCALESEKCSNRRIPIGIGIVFSILMLAIPKYSGIVSSAVSGLLSGERVTLEIMLPIGISFYTFSTVGYLIDVYRAKISAHRSFFDYALYISFFPKLVCGPLVRSTDFFSQLESGKCRVNLKNLETGIQIFVLGIFKKLVLADRLGVFVNDVYSTPKAFSSLTVFLAVISYSFQLYFDFSGYSDMAVGIGKIVGFDLGTNFNLPYISKNLTEFWKRWHISLSSWLQEYLYYPLGGNRKGQGRTYFNLFMTMLIGGIWHGAGITFVIWGALHGIGLVIHKKFMLLKEKHFGSKNAGGRIWNTVSVVLTFAYVSFLWIFFRADSIGNAFEIIKGLFSFRDGITQIYTWTLFGVLIAATYAFCASLRRKKNGSVRTDAFYPLQNLTTYKGLLIFILFTGITIYLSYFGSTAFIYGKF